MQISFKPPKCCITGKLLSHDDNVVKFPLFVNEPEVFRRTPPKTSEEIEAYLTDPVIKCSEGCALRSVFYEWEHKELIIQKVKETLVSTLSFPPTWEDEDYLIIHKPHDSNRFKIYFLKHVFLLDCRYPQWVSFCEQIKNAQDEILLDDFDFLIKFTRLMDRVSILNKPIGKFAQNPYQHIEITLSEWEKFKIVICSVLGVSS